MARHTPSRLILPLLAVAAWPGGPAHAQSSVVIYGRINTALEYANATTATDGTRLGGTGRLTNNRSVFGLRGQEDLGNGVKAIWQIESAVSVDNGTGQIAARDTRVGLDTPYGTLFMGNWDTPYTSATKLYDPYYPTTAGYMSIMGNGAAATTDNVQNTSSFDRRQQNSLHYQTPRWGGFGGAVAWGLPEEKTTDPLDPALYSFAGSYDNGPLNVALAYEIHQHYHAAHQNDEGMKVGATYRLPATTVALVYERLHYRTATGDLMRNSWYLSLVQKAGTGSIKLGLTFAGNGSGDATETVGFFRSGPETGAAQATIGYDYPLSARTAVYAYYSRIYNKRNATYDFAINGLGARAGADPQTFALALRHNF